MDAGAGPDVEHVVGGADGVLVVLDDDDGVAEVAQALEGFEQPRVVALVQADRGLVEHVEHAGQPRADLRGEANALALAAGERAGGAGQREVIEADVDQEFQPLADFLEHAHADLVLLGVELLGDFGEPFAGFAIESSATSEMFLPPILTHSASGLSRAPWQTCRARR